MPDAGASSEALLRRLEWTVLRRLDGLLQGDHRTLWRGAGVDLADLREYQLHDDVRHIDWNVTARLQSPYVRQFTEDRDLSAWFLVDLSASVDFGSAGVSKRDQACAFVAALARVLTRHGNRVGAMLYGQRVDAVLPPGASRRHVLNLLQRLRQPPAQAKAASQVSGGTVLADLLHAAAGVLRQRSLVFVVSDFISAPGWGEALARLAQRHEVLAVRLLDPSDAQLPDWGLLTLQDAETGEQLFVDAGDPGFRRRYAEQAQAQEAAVMQSFVDAGVDVLEISTADAVLDALLRCADLRRQRARLPVPTRFPAPFQRARSEAAA